jgi:hypothetical protein
MAVTIPEGDQYLALRATLNYLQKYFPEVYDRVQSKVAGWIKEIDGGAGRDADQIRDDIFEHSVGTELLMSTLGIQESTAQKIILGKNEGGLNFTDVLELPKVQDRLGLSQPDTGGKTDADPDTLPGVLAGGTTVRVNAGGGQYRWYQTYELPPGSGNWVSFQFSDFKQAEAALGEGFEFNAKTQAWYDKAVVSEGQSEEITGLAGNWTRYSRELARDAAVAAGVRDPTLLGKMLSDPEMKNILAYAAAGDWTPEQILAEQRKTSFWQNVLYPGIKNFYGRTTEPEKAWTNYQDNVIPALTQLGYDIYIHRMLNAGIDAQIFLENAPVFQQAIQNRDFFEVYKQRAAAELGKTVTFGDWFSVLKGEAAPELMKVAEGATVAYTAQQSDFGLSETMLQRLIAERDLSAEEARNVFSDVNQAVLALGEAGLKRGDLTRDDILSASAGIAPNSNLSADQVRLKVAKLAQENDLFDEEKLQFYVGFDPTGRPTRPGLASLSPEGA